MLRKNIVLLAIAILVLFSLALAIFSLEARAGISETGETTPKKIHSPINKVLFSGDSISDGWYASIKSRGFVYLTERALSPEQAIHTHMHGYTVGQIGEKYTIPTGVDLAIVELGTNDVNKGTTYEAFKINYPEYITRVMDKSPEAGLICVGVFPHSRKAQNFDNVIRDTCQSNHGWFIAISDISSNRRAVGPAGTPTWAGKANLGHPNNYGHKLIAQRILDTVREHS